MASKTSPSSATDKPATASVKPKRSARSIAVWLIPLFLGLIIGGVLGYFVPHALRDGSEIGKYRYSYKLNHYFNLDVCLSTSPSPPMPTLKV